MKRRLWQAVLLGAVVGGFLSQAVPSGAQDDSSGEVEWVITIPLTDQNSTTPRGFAVDEEAGEIFAILNVDGSVTFGGGDVPEAAYGTGTYIVRLSLDGTLLAVVALSAPANDLAITRDGDLLVSSAERTLARVGPDGTLRWERHLPGITPGSVVELADGTIVIGAELRGTATFGVGEATETTVTQNRDLSTSSVVAWFGADGSFLQANPWLNVSKVDLDAVSDGSIRVLGPRTGPSPSASVTRTKPGSRWSMRGLSVPKNRCWLPTAPTGNFSGR